MRPNKCQLDVIWLSAWAPSTCPCCGRSGLPDHSSFNGLGDAWERASWCSDCGYRLTLAVAKHHSQPHPFDAKTTGLRLEVTE